MKVTVTGERTGELVIERYEDGPSVTFQLRGPDGSTFMDLETSEIPRFARLLLALVAPE